jgi:hypothetical protein
MLQLVAAVAGGVIAGGSGPLRGLTEALRHWLWLYGRPILPWC